MSWARLCSILFVTALVSAACSADEDGRAGVDGLPTPAVESPIATGESRTEPTSGAFFFDLGTGQRTPLPEGLAGGFSYVASPDGTRMVYEIGGCGTGSVLKVTDLEGRDVATIESPEGLAICAGARWSPDGTRLVYQQRDGASLHLGNLFVHDLASEERTRITDLELTMGYWWFLTATFSADGRSVLFHLPRGSSQTTGWDVWSVPVTGGEPARVVRNATFPIALPDGGVAFVVPTDSSFSGRRIAIADGTGSRRTLVETEDTWWPTLSPDGTRIAYPDGGSIHVVDVSTGESSEVTEGGLAEWLDDDTLIVSPG